MAAGHESAGRESLYRVLYVQVLIAVAIGVLIGALFPHAGASLKPLGDAFIKLVKMIIAPVIFCTVVTGIGGMSDLKKVGRVGAKALLYFVAVSTLALFIGLVVANVIRPGSGLHVNALGLDQSAIAEYRTKAAEQGAVGFLLHIIPDSAVGAFASGDILQVLLFSVLFGFGLALMGERGKALYRFIGDVSGAIFGVVRIIMKAAPLGALGAMAFTVGKFGVGSLAHLAGLIGCFYLTSVIFVLGVLGLIARAGGFSIVNLIRYIKAELLLVLGTSSSEAALPALMEKLEQAGVSKPVVGLVVPTGYSFNLDGTNIYMTLAALFVAQATDTPVSLGDQILLLLVAMVSSKGAAAVSGSGFVTLAATMSVVPTIPVSGIVLILGVDRFMSECRALTNIVGNAVATLIVARWEGELDRGRLQAALNP